MAKVSYDNNQKVTKCSDHIAGAVRFDCSLFRTIYALLAAYDFLK